MGPRGPAPGGVTQWVRSGRRGSAAPKGTELSLWKSGRRKRPRALGPAHGTLPGLRGAAASRAGGPVASWLGGGGTGRVWSCPGRAGELWGSSRREEGPQRRQETAAKARSSHVCWGRDPGGRAFPRCPPRSPDIAPRERAAGRPSAAHGGSPRGRQGEEARGARGHLLLGCSEGPHCSRGRICGRCCESPRAPGARPPEAELASSQGGTVSPGPARGLPQLSRGSGCEEAVPRQAVRLPASPPGLLRPCPGAPAGGPARRTRVRSRGDAGARSRPHAAPAPPGASGPR